MKIDELKLQLAEVLKAEEIARQMREYNVRCRCTAKRLSKKPGLKMTLRRRALRHPGAIKSKGEGAMALCRRVKRSASSKGKGPERNSR